MKLEVNPSVRPRRPSHKSLSRHSVEAAQASQSTTKLSQRPWADTTANEQPLYSVFGWLSLSEASYYQHLTDLKAADGVRQGGAVCKRLQLINWARTEMWGVRPV
jgi:hypothetical protein